MKRYLVLIVIALSMLSGAFAQDDKPQTPITADNAGNLTLIQTLSAHEMAVGALAFHPQDHAVLVSTSRDLSMKIWNAVTGELYLEAFPHNAVAYGLAFAPDGNTLFSGSWDRTVKRYRLLEGYRLDELPAFVGFSHIVDHVQFSAQGDWVGFGVGDGSVHILNTNDFNNRKIFLLDGLVLGDLVFFPTDEPEKALFAVAMGFPEDGVLLGNFDDDDDEWFSIEHGHQNGVTALAIRPYETGWLLIAAGDDGLLEIWRVGFDDGWLVPERLSQITPNDQAWFSTLALNPSGDVLAAGTQEGLIYVYDLATPNMPELLVTLDESQNQPIQALTYNADGTLLASGNEAGQIFIWQP